MKLLSILLILFLLGACKSEEVEFNPAEESDLGVPPESGPGDRPDPVSGPVQPPVNPPVAGDVVDNISVVPSQNKADILFVIDNSASMYEEQQEMARKISRFFSKINKLDWRVGIITTDPYRFDLETGFFNFFADGALLRFPNGSYFLDSSLSQGEAEFQFGQTIQRDEEGSGHERGLHNTYRAILRSLAPGQSEQNHHLNRFFRPSATLSVVLISDEDETTRDSNGNYLANVHMSRSWNLIDLVKQVWGSQKKFQFNSVVVRPGDSSCLGDYERYGYAYADITERTNGVLEDICASDYTGALRKIGDGVVDLQKTYRLQCQPADENGDGRPDFNVVKLQNSGAIPPYQLKGDQVEFTRPLSPGRYQFQYSCFQ